MANLTAQRFRELVDNYHTYVIRGANLKHRDLILKIIKDRHKEDGDLWIPTILVKKLMKKEMVVIEYSILYPYGFLFVKQYDPMIQRDFEKAGLNCRVIYFDRSGVTPPGVSVEEMDTLWEALSGYLEGEEIKHEFEVGDWVRVEEGPFKNSRGEVVQILERILTVRLPLFGRDVPTEIDMSQVELEFRAGMEKEKAYEELEEEAV